MEEGGIAKVRVRARRGSRVRVNERRGVRRMKRLLLEDK
jgi:hypothetical protein